MLGLLNATVFQLRLYLMKRRQFDNLALRKLFRERYDIDIGMYTYGCFDQWRMPGPIRIGRYCSFANTVRSARSTTRWWELDTPERRRLVQRQGDMVNNPSVAALEAWRRSQPVSG